MERFFLRQTIGDYTEKLGENSKDVVVVNADLMTCCRNEKFCKRFPERSFNVGIAEQNMVAFSAGLAHEGFKVYAFSMAVFISMRACEQCRTDIAYGNKNVRLIGVYSGCASGLSGATHWGMEDVAIMRTMPNMIVIEPSDPIQAKRMLDVTIDYKGPVYMRCSIEPVNKIYPDDYSFKIGKANYFFDEENCSGAFICTGIMVHYALEAAKKIKADYNKNICVIDMHTIKPLDENAVIKAAKTKNVIVAQDHFIIGGLGSAVAEVISQNRLDTNFKILGIPDRFDSMAKCDYLYHKYEIDADGLYKNMIEMIGENKK